MSFSIKCNNSFRESKWKIIQNKATRAASQHATQHWKWWLYCSHHNYYFITIIIIFMWNFRVVSELQHGFLVSPVWTLEIPWHLQTVPHLRHLVLSINFVLLSALLTRVLLLTEGTYHLFPLCTQSVSAHVASRDVCCMQSLPSKLETLRLEPSSLPHHHTASVEEHQRGRLESSGLGAVKSGPLGSEKKFFRNEP